MSRLAFTLLLLSALARASDPPPAPTAPYRVTFDASWTGVTHPGAPAGAHFSPLVGCTHDAAAAFWAPGAIASQGIENMAELGATGALLGEFGVGLAAGHVGVSFTGSGILFTPTTDAITFTATAAHPLVTLVTMVAPSPDWFVGVAGLDLMDGGAWASEVVVPLLAWDAGTDFGATFTAPDIDAVPQVPIAPITSGPIGTGVPLGTFTFTRLDAPPPWSDLGGALAGASGAPVLAIDGAPVAGSLLAMSLTGSAPSAPVFLVGGVTIANLPLKGGVLVPEPLVIVLLGSDPGGSVSLAAAFPAGFPGGTTLVLQAWMPDAGGPAGFAASNALCATSG
jgi:hypothetical protein